MSSDAYPYLLVVVEGPSEAHGEDARGESGGIARNIVAHVFGSEVAQNIRIDYWRRIPRSPLRASAEGRRIGARAAQVRYAVTMANVTTAYGAVLLVDNDHLYEHGRSTRLEELREGVESSGFAERAAYGVAQEMVEAWLLADPELLRVSLPAGKCCEALWGDKRDPNANFPKHVLARCVLTPGQLSFSEAVCAWSVVRARPHARSLDAFVSAIEALADRQYAR